MLKLSFVTLHRNDRALAACEVFDRMSQGKMRLRLFLLGHNTASITLYPQNDALRRMAFEHDVQVSLERANIA